MSEESLKDYVLNGMKPYWRKGVKHADAFTAGIADLSGYIKGPGNVFIELKALDDWPKRPETPVKFGLDDLQKDFLKERKGWCFVRVRKEYLLFDWPTSVNLLDTPRATCGILRFCATEIWTTSVNFKEFTSWLKTSPVLSKE